MNIALIGSGTMGSALARHLGSRSSLTICNRNKEKGQKIAKEVGALWADTPAEASSQADFVILAVKPKDFKGVSASFSLKKGQTLLSILSGISLAVLKKAFPDATIVRMMPNTALTVGKGILGFSDEGTLDEKKRKEIQDLFAELGLLLWVPESKMEAFAALAASSPAFVFVMIEAMMDAGVYLGFNSQESKEIVLSVFEGCVALLKNSSKHPAELKSEITSPAGTTIEGLRALEEAGIRTALFNALDETYQKSLRVASESGAKS